tara:strand:+ start:2896 stop:4665 length:1770 start_codon:yes stop_codon:yes gene_type:complete
MDILKNYDLYYHTIGEPIVSDQEYDKLKEELLKKFPNDPYFKEVGYNISDCIDLPYYMGSLDKIKDDNNKPLDNWKKKYKGPYIISDKLDGISALIHNYNNKISIYTRGNGKCGRDISHITKYIKGIPKKIEDTYAIRGELILSKKNWNSSYGSNPRNVVAGIINSKTINKEILPKIEFVAYDIIHPRSKIQDSLSYLQNNNFHVVNSQSIESFTSDSLSDILMSRKINSDYEIDGIVLYDNSTIYEFKACENPKYAVAFKSMKQHEEVTVKVKNVEWNISKDGYLKPKVIFDSVELDGVNISATTGYNALYIKNNMINIGSELSIIRSGGVIPKIYRIVTKSSEPLMPTVNYKWNSSGVDIEIIDSDNDDANIKTLLYFMKTLEIKLVAEATLKKLYKAGFKTIPDLLNIKIDEIIKLDGFNKKSGEQIINAIQSIKTKEKYQIMAASNIFGRNLGLKKIKLICDNLQDKDLTYENLIAINGIGKINAQAFVDNIDTFNEFYSNLNITQEIKKQKTQDNTLQDVYIVFSGFRDNELKKRIEEKGGHVNDTITKRTTLLLVKDINEQSGKIKDAKKSDIKIIQKDKYNV